jgi:hypothetical protein
MAAGIQPLSREQAAQLGRKRYYAPDSPCAKGHVAERYTASRQCCECSAIASRERKRTQRAKKRALALRDRTCPDP